MPLNCEFNGTFYLVDAVNLIRNYYANLDNIHSILTKTPKEKETTISNILKNIYLNEEVQIYNDLIQSSNVKALKGYLYLDQYYKLFYEEELEHKIKFIPRLSKIFYDKPDNYLIIHTIIDSLFINNYSDRNRVFSRLP